MDCMNAALRTASVELQDVWDTLYWAYESQGEIEAQYGSEVALFGDAGPGQAIDVANGRYHLADLEARAYFLASIEGFLPYEFGPPAPAGLPFGDEPF